jgi:mRNA-degrading endonuclease RelE of RelBE toxin-antitoxin system
LSYRVRFTEEAKKDLGLQLTEEAVDAIEQALTLLEKFPFSCRKAADGMYGPFLRELVISLRSTGYVVLFEIEGRDAVTVVAVRHQRESDFY